MKRIRSRRVKVHLLNYKAPTPKCERTRCGLRLWNVAYTTDEDDVTCGHCRRIVAHWAKVAATPSPDDFFVRQRAMDALTHPLNTDASALDHIAAILTGSEWNADTITHIADIVRHTGRTVTDL